MNYDANVPGPPGSPNRRSTPVAEADGVTTVPLRMPLGKEATGAPKAPGFAEPASTDNRIDPPPPADPGPGAGNAAGPAVAASAQSLKVGDILKNRFVIEEEIGAGGMGVVFKALDLRKMEAKDREPYVALKVLNQQFQEDPISLIALQREAKRAQTLSHPNIINVYDFDRDGSRVYMSMEYLDQRPLSHFIRELPAGGLRLAEAWPIISGMGAALAYAHKKNIVHSDFKPGNVFIDEAKEIKVLDFGIACAVARPDQDGREATVFEPRSLGALTPAYASLEMFSNIEPDPRDDIYALACVTYELLTGKHPFERRTAMQALALNLKPKPVPGLNRRQRHGLERGLALQRAERTPTVEQFLKDLDPRPLISYRVWLAAGGGLALVLAAAMGIWFRTGTPVQRPPTPVVLTEEQQAKVKDLLEIAEIHSAMGYLTAPVGSNALWAYQEALKIDPSNEVAYQGIRKITDTLEQEARDLHKQGKTEEAMAKVLEGLEADPQHRGLLKLKDLLQQ